MVALKEAIHSWHSHFEVKRNKESELKIQQILFIISFFAEGDEVLNYRWSELFIFTCYEHGCYPKYLEIST